jgi:hypothetical protein
MKLAEAFHEYVELKHTKTTDKARNVRLNEIRREMGITDREHAFLSARASMSHADVAADIAAFAAGQRVPAPAPRVAPKVSTAQRAAQARQRVQQPLRLLIEKDLTAAAAPEIAQGRTLRAGARAQVENIEVWQNGQIMQHVEDVALGIVQKNTALWKHALGRDTRPENVDATTWQQAKAMVQENIRKGMTKTQAVEAEAVRQSQLTAVVAEIDKSGLGNIHETTADSLGTKAGYAVPDVISKELFEHIMHRSGDHARRKGAQLTADALLGTVSDERFGAAIGKNIDLTKMNDALQQAKNEVNMQYRVDMSDADVRADLVKRGILVPDGHVNDVRDARNQIRDIEVQRRAAAAEKGYQPVTAQEETKILTAIATRRIRNALMQELGRRPTNAEMTARIKRDIKGEVQTLQDYLGRTDLRTYQVEMGARGTAEHRVMNLFEWGGLYLRNKNLIGDFAFHLRTVTIKPGMKRGSIIQAYKDAEAAGAGHTDHVKDALNLKGSNEFKEMLDVLKPIDQAGDVDVKVGEQRLKISAAKEGEPTRIEEGDVVQVFFRLNGEGRAAIEKKLGEYVRSTADDAKVDLNDKRGKEIVGKVNKSRFTKELSEEQRTRVARLMKQLGVNEVEGFDILRRSEAPEGIAIEQFADIVTRKGYTFGSGDIGFSEGNTQWAHDGQNQVTSLAVAGVANSTNGQNSITMGNLTWAMLSGTDANALTTALNRAISAAGVKGLQAGVRVVEARGGKISGMYQVAVDAKGNVQRSEAWVWTSRQGSALRPSRVRNTLSIYHILLTMPYSTTRFSASEQLLWIVLSKGG